jgi:hypothetical protein
MLAQISVYHIVQRTKITSKVTASLVELINPSAVALAHANSVRFGMDQHATRSVQLVSIGQETDVLVVYLISISVLIQ